VAVVSVSVRLGPASAPVGTASLNLLSLNVSAAVAAGGIDCPPPAPLVVLPADGSELEDATPTFSGTGTPGAAINLIVDGTTVSNAAAVDPDGDWSYTPVAPLDDGAHTVSATQTLNGATSPESAENDFTIQADTQAPAAPVVTAPADGSRTNDNTPTLTGRGEPGATVTVRVNGDVVGTPTVDGNGNWNIEPPTEPVPDGQYTISAAQTDQAGNTSPADDVVFTIDSGALPPMITEPAEGSRTNRATPTIGGTSEPGAIVTVRVDGVVVGTATAQQNGTWKLILTEPLADGEHRVSATQTDLAGNTSPPTEVGFAVDTDTTTPIDTPDSGVRLAETGGPPLVAVVLAAALLATGAMPLALRRGRRGPGRGPGKAPVVLAVVSWAGDLVDLRNLRRGVSRHRAATRNLPDL
jgi:hypothetical protein